MRYDDSLFGFAESQSKTTKEFPHWLQFSHDVVAWNSNKTHFPVMFIAEWAKFSTSAKYWRTESLLAQFHQILRLCGSVSKSSCWSVPDIFQKFDYRLESPLNALPNGRSRLGGDEEISTGNQSINERSWRPNGWGKRQVSATVKLNGRISLTFRWTRLIFFSLRSWLNFLIA